MTMSTCTSPEDQLTCSICGQLYEEPRILPCLHTFCTKCIESLDAFIPSLSTTKCLRDSGRPSVILREPRDTMDSSKDSGAVSGYGSEKSSSPSVSSFPFPKNHSRTSTSSRSTLQSDSCGREKSRTILCPTCDSEVDLPKDGASHLPLHYILQSKAFTASLTVTASDGYRLESICELCVGDVHAVSWCADCRVAICAFCLEAHKRQRKTGSHKVQCLSEAETKRDTLPNKRFVRSRDRPRPVCAHHLTEELTLFCDICKTMVCQECCSHAGQHHNHQCRFVSEVAKVEIDDLKKLLAKALLNLDSVKKSLTNVRAMSKKVHVRGLDIGEEVNRFADGYIKAVEVHRQNLLDKTRKMCEVKQRILKLQSIQLEQCSEDMETLCAFVELLLHEGSDVEILTLLSHVVKRLQDLGLEKQKLEPRVDEYLNFLKKESCGLVNGYPIHGCLTTQKLCPSNCVLKGNGLPAARQGQLVDAILITKDTEGLPIRKGGQNLTVELTSKEDKRHTPIKVVDRKNGTYALKFVPRETGLFWLNVRVKDAHIKGSPFPVQVKSKWQSHTGSFHCCTFCSSGGNKEVECGCGGTMPGGFKGCGHGHRGHPGKKHWSCCGKLAENSECSHPSPKIYEFTL